RSPWLRLRWPYNAQGETSSTTLWSGVPIQSLRGSSAGWLFASADGSVHFWQDGSPTHEWATDGEITVCDLSSDQQIAAVGFASGKVILYDTRIGEVLGILSRHRETINDVKFSPDGRYVLTASDDKLMLLWDIDTAKVIQTFY